MKRPATWVAFVVVVCVIGSAWLSLRPSSSNEARKSDAPSSGTASGDENGRGAPLSRVPTRRVADAFPPRERPAITAITTSTPAAVRGAATNARDSAVAPFRFPAYEPGPDERRIFPGLFAQVREASAAAFRTSSSAASSAFQTSYHKIECGAIVANMCVWGGQPRYFRERGTKGFTSTGATRCCNEAHTKLRFHAVVYDASSGSSSSPSSSSLSEQLPPSLRATANDAESSTTVTIGQGGPVVVSNNTLLVTPMCWEEVGYHLFLCVLNTWALMSQLRIGHPASSTSAPPHVKIALLKSWTPNRLGNAADWWSPKRQQDTSPAQPVAAATFWAWWSVVADSPADVVDIASLPPMCVPLALVAGRAHPLTPSLQQRFRAEMLRRLRVPDPLRPRRHCETGRTSRVVVVTVVDRARTFRLLNCREIASQFARVGARLALNVSVRVVVFERLPLREQMAIAVGTDVLVGMHGNGLTWAAFMARGSALVELWPSVAYNSNYEHIAGRAGVRRWQVLGGASNNCPKRCQAAVPVSDDVVGETLRFVSAVRCGATLYDGESDYLRSLASYAEQKRQKRNKLRSGASPPET